MVIGTDCPLESANAAILYLLLLTEASVYRDGLKSGLEKDVV